MTKDDEIDALQQRIYDNTAICVKRVADLTRERNALRAEVERLKDETEIRKTQFASAEFAVGELKAEVERLKVTPSYVWAAISKTHMMLFANEEDARKMAPTATSAYDIQRLPVCGETK